MTTDVVIAGGGPNGLLMACELALADVSVVVLERLPERATAPGHSAAERMVHAVGPWIVERDDRAVRQRRRPVVDVLMHVRPLV